MSEQLSFFGFGAAPTLTDGLFFAVLPDLAAKAQLARIARRLRTQHGLSGKPLETERFHISLHNLGSYVGFPHSLVAAASEAAATIAASPFDVTFDCVANFGGQWGNRSLVLCGRDGVAALIAFQKVLVAAMTKVGLGRLRSRFSPHVTLLYDERAVDGQPVEPVSWTVREFVLVHSLIGQSYHIPLQRWPLRD